MQLTDIRDALLTIMPDVFHHQAESGNFDRYIVWAEDGGGDSLWADGKMQNQVITGTVDMFTRDEYDPAFAAVQTALSDIELSFKLNSIQHEKNTGYIHYEWSWEVG